MLSRRLGCLIVSTALPVLAAGCGSHPPSVAVADAGTLHEERAAPTPPPALAPARQVQVARGSEAFLACEVVRVGAMDEVTRAPAHVAFRDGAVSSVHAPVEGLVREVHVQVGDQVRAGAPLVTVYSPAAAEARAELARADVALQLADTDAARQDEMMTRGVGVAAEQSAARARAREARVDLDRWRTRTALLGDGTASVITVRAPRAGIVTARAATVGATANPTGDPLVQLGDPRALWVVADVFEQDLPRIRPGAAARIDIPARAEPLTARVLRIGAAVDEQARRAPVFLELTGTPAGLRPGLLAQASVSTDTPARLTVPVSAVLITGAHRYVAYVRQSDGLYAPRPLELGQRLGDRVEILRGLAAGEQVVVTGALLLDHTASQLL